MRDDTTLGPPPPLQLLRAAVGDPEACDHLVEHEQYAVLVADFPDVLEEALIREYTMPMFPMTGSMMRYVISAAFSLTILLTVSIWSNSATRVCFARSDGTPALSGVPKVARPEPAFTSRLSTCP